MKADHIIRVFFRGGVLLKDAGFAALWPQFAALSALAFATLSYAVIRFPKTLGR